VKEEKKSQAKKRRERERGREKSNVCVNQYLKHNHSTKHTYTNKKKQKTTIISIASFSSLDFSFCFIETFQMVSFAI
jgi:hypothetical protein